MILGVRANQDSFRSVEFIDGFNVVIAERSKNATAKDTRNGLGKTTLLNIIHFCFGADERPRVGLRAAELQGWEFSSDLVVGDTAISVSRSVDNQGVVNVGAPVDWFPSATEKERSGAPEQQSFDFVTESVLPTCKTAEWITALGVRLYGIPTDVESSPRVTFRNLVSYDVRRHQFRQPFENHPRQSSKDTSVCNAYMLALNWDYGERWQRLTERKKEVDSIKRSVRAGENLLASILGSPGDLESERVRLQNAVARNDEELQSFQVHPQYLQIQNEGNELTRQIHEANNRALQLKRLVDFHVRSTSEELPARNALVAELYENAGTVLPNAVAKRLEEVQEFHLQVTRNRLDYLRTEAKRLEQELEDTNREIQQRTNRRAKLMKILETHGALEEYSELQHRHLEQRSRLEAVQHRIEQLDRVETETSKISIEREQLFLDAQRDLKERTALTRAQALFNSNFEALYETPGNLIVYPDRQTGYMFRIDIKREGSSGIDKMKVFCYDLMRAELWSTREIRPGFLIHDSDIFAGVDERQVARALELAERKSRECGFQYIVCLNSDQVPRDEFSEDFDFDSFVRLTLTDDSPEGSLLGMRF